MKILPESLTQSTHRGSISTAGTIKHKRKKKMKLQCDRLTKVALAVSIVLIATIAVVEISTSDMQSRVQDRISRNLLWRLGRLNRDYYAISLSCDNPDDELVARLNAFENDYAHAKRQFPGLKSESKYFRDYRDEFLNFDAAPNASSSCGMPSVSRSYKNALSKYRKSIGVAGKEQRNLLVVFDSLISVLALIAGVTFALLAVGRRVNVPSSKKNTGRSSTAQQATEDEQAANQAEEHEDSVLNLISVAAVVAGKSMTILDINEAACALFGYERESLLGQNVKRLMPEDAAEKHDSYVEFYLRSGASTAIGADRCVPALKSDGTVLDVTIKLLRSGYDNNPTFTAFFRNKEDPEAIAGFDDVTNIYTSLLEVADNKRSLADALTAKEDLLRNLSVPVIVANEEMTIKEVNDAACRIFGYELFELKGKNVKTLMYDNVAVKHDSYIKRHLETGVNRIVGSNVGRKVEAKHKDGSTLQLILNVGKANASDGSVMFTAILQDITGLSKKTKEIEDEKERTSALVSSQQKFLQDLAVGVVVADKSMKIKDVNSAAMRIFGYLEEDMVGQNVKFLMFPGELQDNHDDIVANYLSTGEAKIIGSFEGRQVTAKAADGSALEIVLNISKSFTQDDPPQPQFTAVFQDVTALSQTMKNLEKEREATTAMIADQERFLKDLAVGVIVADKTMTIKDVNTAATRIFGYERGDLVGKNVKILMPEGDLKHGHDEIVKAYLRTGKAKIIGSFEGRQVSAKAADGSDLEIILNVSKSMTRDSPAQPIFTAVFQNVTELSNQMNALNKEREATRLMVQGHEDFLKNLAVGVVIADKSMTIKNVNDAATRIFGWDREEMIGQNVTMLMPPGDLKDSHDRIIEKYIRTGKAKIIGISEGRQVSGKAKNGADLDLIINVSKSMTRDDPPQMQFTAVFQNVTKLASKGPRLGG